VTLQRTERDGVVELRLNRPQVRNALSTGLLEELRDALRDDPAALVLCGAGDVFCAGADTREPAERSDARLRLVSEVLRRLQALEAPTIAAVQGAAIGAGWGLALACDLCFASEDARFALPELAKGFRIPRALMERLVEVVGPVRAAELTLAGTAYDAEAAERAGCVTRVLPTREALHDEAWALARELAARPRRPSEAIW
jgi:enoyl-CoA hydratase/carnithine racemase